MKAADHWTLLPASCPVCGADEAKFLGFRGGWAHRGGLGVAVAVVRCRACGTTYPNPTPHPRDHSHYDDATDYFGPGDDAATIGAFEAMLGEAAALCGGAGRLLDVGCGLGQSLVAAANTGWDAVGLEPSAAFAQEGRRRFGVQIDERVLVPGLFEPDRFDAVLLSGVLEHVYDPVGLLTLAGEVLRPGGVVYVDVPNESGWLQEAGRIALRARRRDWCISLSPTFPPFHVVGFSPRALRTAFERAGLQTVRVDGYPLSLASSGLPRPALALADVVERVAGGLGRASGLVGWARAAR
jgi:SAM-dependent methyltransferase